MELRRFTDILKNRQQIEDFKDVLNHVYLTELPSAEVEAGKDAVSELLNRAVYLTNGFVGDWRWPFKEAVIGEEYGFWTEAVKNQCVVSALHTLVDTIMKEADEAVTARDMMKNLNGKGPLAARRDGTISEDCKAKKYTKAADSKIDTLNGNYASAGIAAIRKKLSDAEYETFFKDERSHDDTVYVNDIRLADYDVLEAILKFRETTSNNRRVDYFAKKIHKMYVDEKKRIDASEYIKYFDMACRYAFGKVPRSKDGKEEKADYLIKVYKIERYYDFSLNKTILNCIAKFDYEHHDLLKPYYNSDAFLELLCDLSELPNVFSRDIMCIWLFRQLEFAIIGKFDFYPVFERWIEEAKTYIHNAAKIYFPMAEKTFLCLLIERYNIEKIKDVWDCIESLLNYINIGENYLNIIEPRITIKEDTESKNSKLQKYTFYKDIQNLEVNRAAERVPLYDEIKERARNNEYDEILVGYYSGSSWPEIKKNGYMSEYNFGFFNHEVLKELSVETKKERIYKILEKAGFEITSEDNKGKFEKTRVLNEGLDLVLIKMRRIDTSSQDLVNKNQRYTALLSSIIRCESNIAHPSEEHEDIFEKSWLYELKDVRWNIIRSIAKASIDQWTSEGRRNRINQNKNGIDAIVVAGEKQGNRFEVIVEKTNRDSRR